MTLVRLFAPLALLLLAACASKDGLDEPPPLGDFRLGFNVVVGKTASLIPPSRGATAEEWEAVLGEEIDKRFRRYEGERLYHFGVSVDAYALAIPGVPVVVKPRSVLVFTVTVWDDATQQKLNVEPQQMTVLESTGFLTGKSIIGSGLTQSKEEQMRNLSYAAARAIQRWLVKNEAWFDGDPETQPPPEPEPPVDN